MPKYETLETDEYWKASPDKELMKTIFEKKLKETETKFEEFLLKLNNNN